MFKTHKPAFIKTILYFAEQLPNNSDTTLNF